MKFWYFTAKFIEFKVQHLYLLLGFTLIFRVTSLVLATWNLAIEFMLKVVIFPVSFGLIAGYVFIIQLLVK